VSDDVDEESSRLRRQAHGVITGKNDLGLPLSPEPTRPGRAPSPAPAPPPVKSAAPPLPVDDTVPVPMMEEGSLTRDGTPPPLPPSPASHAAEVWLEDAVTRPSALTDIAASMNSSSGTRAPVRSEMDPIEALREAHAQAARTSRKLLALSTTTAFAVGLALGAVLFRGCH
jgi:hypothetical protein